MQTLITLNAGDPYNHVIGSIGGRDPRRAAPGLILAPGECDRGRTCRCNLVSLDHVGVVMKTNVRSLAGVVGDSRCSPVTRAYIRLSHW